MELLVSRSGEPFSRGEILKEVWGYTPERHVDTRVVDVHISRLRSKLEADPANPELILTEGVLDIFFNELLKLLLLMVNKWGKKQRKKLTSPEL